MSKNLSASLHWLIIGLVLIAAFFVGRALVTYYVPQAASTNYPLSFYSEAKLTYVEGEDLGAIRQKAYAQANQKAADVASLTGKKLGKLTAVSESIIDSFNSSPEFTPISQEASPGAKPKDYILGLTYELN